MLLVHCNCDGSTPIYGATHFTLPPIPSRKDLAPLDTIAKRCLGEDTAASLSEMQASPNVAHLGEPRFAPQQPDTRLRVVVSGSDAALGAVLTRMMRGDYLWSEVAYVPSDPASPAATCWGIPADAALSFATDAPVVPAACIRTDTSEVLAGAAELTCGDGHEEFLGEIVVDSHTLLFRGPEQPSARFYGGFGARLVPTMRDPGIACTPLVTPVSTSASTSISPQQLEWMASVPGLRWIAKGKQVEPLLADASQVRTGRAVQAGGIDIRVRLNGMEKPRGVNRVTFYRHLRDLQSVRQP